MNLKKLKLLLPLSVLSTSFMFNSADAMKVNLRQQDLTNIFKYLSKDEVGKFVQVSKKAQRATLKKSEKKLEKCFLSNVFQYIPRNKLGEFVQVSSNTQDATFIPKTGVWEDLVFLLIKEKVVENVYR